jgi:hypothetical protein
MIGHVRGLIRFGDQIAIVDDAIEARELRLPIIHISAAESGVLDQMSFGNTVQF